MAGFHQLEAEMADNTEKIDNSKRNNDAISISHQPKSNKTKKQKLISTYFPQIHSQPCTNINNMNDDCLIHLLGQQFELQELMHLRAVCTQWQALIERLFIGKQYLKIFFSEYAFQCHLMDLRTRVRKCGMENREDDEKLFTMKSDANGVDDVLVLKIEHSDPIRPYDQFIPQLFPSVQNLFVIFPPIICLSDYYHAIKIYRQLRDAQSKEQPLIDLHSDLALNHMLKQWPQLVCLSLKNIFISPNLHQLGWLDKFGQTLQTHLPLLSSLHVFTKSCTFIRRLPGQVLARLKRLTMVSEENVEYVANHGKIVELLPLLAKCTRLISIGYNGLLCDQCLARPNLTVRQNTQLTHLTFLDGNKYFGDYSRFDKLTFLDIVLFLPIEIPYPRPFQKLIQKLEKLTNLTELRLVLGGSVHPPEDMITAGLVIKPNLPISVLSSVQILHFNVEFSFVNVQNTSNTAVEPTSFEFTPSLPKIFPNLAVAKIVNHRKERQAHLEMCFQSKGPNHFPHLRTVEFSRNSL